jgi:tetratricopeptide (TPR) repeat protein
VEDESERTALSLLACHQVLSLGWRMGGSEAEATAVYEEGRALAERSGDRAAAALLVGRYGQIRINVAGSALDGVRYGEEAARLAQECEDPALRAAIGTFPAFAHNVSGDGRAMLDWADRVLAEVGADNERGKEIVGYSPRVAMLNTRANGLANLGRLEEAWSQVRELEHIAEEAREPEVLSWLGGSWAMLAYARGGTESVLEPCRRSLEIAEKLDNEASRIIAYHALGLAYLIEGQPTAAREALRESAAIARDRRTLRTFLVSVLAHLAETHLALGERSEALATAREAIALASAGGCRFFEAEAQLALARALLATEGAPPRAEIESALDRTEQLVESIAARALSPRILELRGRLASALGDAPASDRALRQALELYRAIGATGHAERLARELDT